MRNEIVSLFGVSPTFYSHSLILVNIVENNEIFYSHSFVSQFPLIVSKWGLVLNPSIHYINFLS